MSEIAYNKLVRDLVPGILTDLGKIVTFKRLEDDELAKALKDKVIEEAYELNKADTELDIIDEIADVLTVLEAVAEHYDISWKTIIKYATSKCRAKGGFDNGCYLMSVVDVKKSEVENE